MAKNKIYSLADLRDLLYYCSKLLNKLSAALLLLSEVLWIDGIPMPELQDIFNGIRLKSMSSAQVKAFHMIRRCRTSYMGVKNRFPSLFHSYILLVICLN